MAAGSRALHYWTVTNLETLQDFTPWIRNGTDLFRIHSEYWFRIGTYRDKISRIVTVYEGENRIPLFRGEAEVFFPRATLGRAVTGRARLDKEKA